jgi:hypothetical protein
MRFVNRATLFSALPTSRINAGVSSAVSVSGMV